MEQGLMGSAREGDRPKMLVLHVLSVWREKTIFPNPVSVANTKPTSVT